MKLIPKDSLTPYTYKAIVVDVYDADSITVDLDNGFRTWVHGMKIRLGRIDAYEVRLSKKNGVTVAHKRKGIEARDWLRDLIEDKEIIVKTSFEKKLRGKYGRVLAEIFVEIPGGYVNVNDRLVELRHAKYKKY